MTTSQDNEPTEHDELASAAGWSFVGLGVVCLVISTVLPLVVDTTDPAGPFVGLPGMRIIAAFMIIGGAGALLTVKRRT